MASDERVVGNSSTEDASGEVAPTQKRLGVGRRLKPALVGGVAILLATAGALWMRDRFLQPFGPPHPTLVEIPRGFSVQNIARRLEDSKVVSSALLFRWYVRAQSIGGELKAGEYRFDRPLSLVQVVEKLHRGDVYYRRVTLREGLDLRQVVSELASQGWGAAERFDRLVHDATAIFDLDQAAEDLEGYLFPDTYFFPRSAAEEEIIRAMLERQRTLWTAERRQQAQRLGFNIRQTLTLASLIEKETALAQERRLVSSVFHNRLRRNIPLACDPTVIYAVKRVKEYDGIIHRSDLEFDSPYNTYLYLGLPPGPIANPGLASIEAALDPAPTDFLFFVSRNDGSHVFSSSLREHERAVRQHQR